jgi:hypothetical protein
MTSEEMDMAELSAAFTRALGETMEPDSNPASFALPRGWEHDWEHVNVDGDRITGLTSPNSGKTYKIEDLTFTVIVQAR